PEFDKAYANIGRLYHRRDRDPEAVAALDRALQLNPFLAPAQAVRGLARARLGNVREGLRDVQEALRHDPTAKTAHLAYAEVLVRAGQAEAAEKALAEALKRWPLDAASFAHAAQLRLGKAGKAFANLALANDLA